MPYAHASCLLDDPESDDSRLISPRTEDTQHLRTPAAQQWLHATTGRIATDPYSWMQAIHWVAGSGLYTPSRTHGPKWGPTTIAIAQEISALKECRPGVNYLARKLKVAVRTVKYHLGMLREAGLLVYVSKGTRVRGEGGRASVFERVIPVQFDEALGIRTIGEGATRRPIGAAPESRSLLGKLAKKASRKTRRRPRRTPVSRRGLCTPMQGGTSSGSSAASTYSPSESKLASGQAKSQHRKKAKRGQRALNKVGRRYQLGREATRVIPWLQGASVPRISWVLADFADAGWTIREVQAVAESIPMPAFGVKRPSGMLADRLRGKAGMSKSMRDTYVAMWEESRAAEHARHNDADYDGLSGGPKSLAVRRAWGEALDEINSRLTANAPEAELAPLSSIDDLTREEIIDLRLEAVQNPDVVLDMIQALGERDARRLYTHRLVDQTLALEAINARRNTLAPAF